MLCCGGLGSSKQLLHINSLAERARLFSAHDEQRFVSAPTGAILLTTFPYSRERLCAFSCGLAVCFCVSELCADGRLYSDHESHVSIAEHQALEWDVSPTCSKIGQLGLIKPDGRSSFKRAVKAEPPAFCRIRLFPRSVCSGGA